MYICPVVYITRREYGLMITELVVTTHPLFSPMISSKEEKYRKNDE
tara:strand:+ start:64 stop:201 length:138 start_codon:yes stop_codon:yes gene_type:complete